MLQKLFLVQLPQQILIFHPEPSRHSPALEFKLKNLSYIHSLNKTKQPFYNLLQYFRVKVENSKKKIRKFNPRKYKIASLYCKKYYQNILSRTGFIKVLRLSS
jgi:hypothetical protein